MALVTPVEASHGDDPGASLNCKDLSPKSRACRRVLGLIRRKLLFSRNHIWIAADVSKTAKTLGYTERHMRRVIAALRFQNLGIEFAVIFDHGRLAWRLLMASRDNLAFDCLPLFLDRKNRPRHTKRHIRNAICNLAGFVTNKKQESDISEARIIGGSLSENSRSKDNSDSVANRDSGRPRPPCNSTPPPPKNGVFGNPKEKLKRKAVVLSLWLEREQQLEGVAVGFNRYHAFIFCLEGITDGYLDRVITKSWIDAAWNTHRDNVDGLTRCEPALMLWHARNKLRSSDSLSRVDRIRLFYRARAEGRFRLSGGKKIFDTQTNLA